MAAVTSEGLRNFAVNHTLFPPTTLKRAVDKLGFVQADPIRAPSRAQDLILRHRVKDYRDGDLDRRYGKLNIAEDFFINYGFVTPGLQGLMHPRPETTVHTSSRKRVRLILEFVSQRGTVHPREVDAYFAHGTVTNYWGGSSNATTHLLDEMLYRGLLRVVRRERGIRMYGAHRHATVPADAAEIRRRLDLLVDAAVNIYAPLHDSGLSILIRRLRYAAPQWHGDLKGALQRAQQRLSHERIDGVVWYWPEEACAASREPPEMVRLLTPFDPVVWDRARFELLWGWAYRFEAYTPVAKRQRGYYAMPMLWRNRVIGWANISVIDGALKYEFGYVESRPPRERKFQRELDAELERVRRFLAVD